MYHAGPNLRGGVSLLFGLFSFGGLVIGATLSTRLLKKRGPQVLPLVNGLMVIEFGAGIILMALAPWIGLSILFAGLLGIGASGFLPPYLAMVALVLAGFNLTGAAVNPARWFGTVVWEKTVPSLMRSRPSISSRTSPPSRAFSNATPAWSASPESSHSSRLVAA